MGIVIGLVAGAALLSVTTKQYKATSAVLVLQTGVGATPQLQNSRTSGPINLDTEAQLAASESVAAEVHKIDKLTQNISEATLRQNLTITVPANTEILNLTYESTNKRESARIADDFAQAYINVRLATAQAELAAQLATVDSLLSSLTKQFKEVQDSIQGLPPKSKDKPKLNAEKGSLSSQVNALTKQSNNLKTTTVTAGQITSKASVPKKPSSPSKIIYLAGGLVIGLLLGLAGASLSFTRWRRVVRPVDITEALRLPVAANLVGRRLSGQVIAETRRTNEYRRLAHRVRATVKQPGVIVVAGVDGPVPSQRLAAQLAAALAKSGERVSLLSLVDGSPTGNVEVGDKVTVLSREDADVSHELTREHANVLRAGGYLIVAAHDLIGSPDAQALAAIGDAILLVVRRATRLKTARAALAELDAIGAPVLGAVLIPTRGRRARPIPAEPTTPKNKTKKNKGKTKAKDDAAEDTDLTDLIDPAAAVDARIAPRDVEPERRGAPINESLEPVSSADSGDGKSRYSS